jgi:Cdc6-like AAA superfamily ATPase
MLRIMVEEFNCNHQADLDSKLVTIYQRDKEHEKIEKFLENNIRKNKSGLMYLCGHPGTGKTSSLNYVLSEMSKNKDLSFKPLLFNAMTYSDVKSFSM